jgi:nucleoside-diphosphate-sugar epimerase
MNFGHKVKKASSEKLQTPYILGLPLFGAMCRRLDHIAIDDCIYGVITLMKSNYDDPINIRSERIVSIINGLADIIADISGKKITKKYALSTPQGVRGRNADIQLGYRSSNVGTKVSLEECLAKTYSGLRNNVSQIVLFTNN